VFDFDDLCAQNIDESIIRIVMFNVTQSVALDFYSHESEMLLEKVNGFAAELEHRGKIKISKRNMLKFIGLTLNRKNRVIDNLYIFDVPEVVWDDKILDEINSGLVRLFDLRTRFREVQSNFKNIEEVKKVHAIMDAWAHCEEFHIQCGSDVIQEYLTLQLAARGYSRAIAIMKDTGIIVPSGLGVIK